MENNISKTDVKEVIFPEESSLIIEKILEKYGFKEIQEKGIEDFFSSFDSSEREKIFESLPGTKISRLVKEYAVGKISLADIPERLGKELNISFTTAKQMAEDLENNLLVFITVAKEKPPVTEIRPEEKLLEETKKPSTQKDIYREPIE